MENKTQIILVIGFLFIGLVIWLGFDNLAQDQPKSNFEACMESLDGATWKEYDDKVAKIMVCRGQK